MRSMTGFAAVTRDVDQLTLNVTLRAINHRHLDLQCRLPASLQAAETAIRAQVQRTVARGRLELAIQVQAREAAVPAVEVNEALLTALDAAFAPARAKGIVQGVLTPGDVLRLPHVVTVGEARETVDPDTVRAAAERAVEDALAALDAMRRSEGDYLAAELETRLAALEALVSDIEAAAADGAEQLTTRLLERVGDLRLDPALDPSVLAQEVVKYVARSDVREELVRLRAHIGHWRQLVAGTDPVGRTLDFLLQEMNREVNTIGAKAEGTRVSALVVQAKAELEKMREQVQNVE
jgi:uncharacterized protein (TIGR00255 family)